jgi:hypothetical protein
MSEKSENNLITIPKFSDNWLKKSAVVLVFVLIAYLFVTPDNIKYFLAVTVGYVLINDVELRSRALMINIMDHQLIKVSEQADRLEQQLEILKAHHD